MLTEVWVSYTMKYCWCPCTNFSMHDNFLVLSNGLLCGCVCCPCENLPFLNLIPQSPFITICFLVKPAKPMIFWLPSYQEFLVFSLPWAYSGLAVVTKLTYSARMFKLSLKYRSRDHFLPVYEALCNRALSLLSWDQDFWLLCYQQLSVFLCHGLFPG